MEARMVPPAYAGTPEERAAHIIGEHHKSGLLAIAYAVADLAEATRNPEWMKP